MAGPDEPTARRRPRKLAAAELQARRAAIQDPETVLAAAGRLLEPAPRTESELRGRLIRGGYRPELVRAALTRLIELGYIDDEKFARAWVEARDRSRPRGGSALRRELIRKGVDSAIVGRVLADRGTAPPSPGDESAISADETAAGALVAKRARSLARVAPLRRRAWIYALLARNGFDPDVCRTVANRFAGRFGAEAPDPQAEEVWTAPEAPDPQAEGDRPVR